MLHRNDDFPVAYDDQYQDQYSQMIQAVPMSDLYTQQDASYPVAMYPTYPFIPPMDYGDFDDSVGTEQSSGDFYEDYLGDYFRDIYSNDVSYYDGGSYGGWYGDGDSSYYDYDPRGQMSEEDQGSCSAECGVTSFQSGNRMAGERVIGGDKVRDVQGIEKPKRNILITSTMRLSWFLCPLKIPGQGS